MSVRRTSLGIAGYIHQGTCRGDRFAPDAGVGCREPAPATFFFAVLEALEGRAGIGSNLLSALEALEACAGMGSENEHRAGGTGGFPAHRCHYLRSGSP